MGTNPTKLALSLSAILGLSSLSLCVSANAQQSNTEAVSDIHQIVQHEESMVVIGRRAETPLNIAANVNVIDAAEIQMSGATNLGDLLRGHGGIQVSNNNTGPVFSMRGFTASQAANNTLILVDGRRLNNIDIAAPNVSAISLNQIERVEILSGSSRVLYGDQAVGGVINIITKAPNSTGGSLALSGGSFDTLEAKGDVAGVINDAWQYYLAGQYSESDNYRDDNADETSSILGRLQYQTLEEDFYIEANYFDNERQTPGSLTKEQLEQNPRQSNPWNKGDYIHDMTTALRSGYHNQINDTWTLGADVSYTDSNNTNLQWGSSGRNDRTLLSISPKAVAKYQIESGELNIITGIDYNLGESIFSFGRSNQQTQSSAYVQATVPLTTTLSYVVGGRYAEADDDLVDENVYPNGIGLDQDAHAFELGLNYRPNTEHRLYVRADDNFRFAKVDEQAYTSPGTVGLKPQVGRSFEAGWDYAYDIHNLKINLFQLDLEDEIVWDPSAEKPVGGSFDGANINADASRRYGVSTAYDIQLSPALMLGVTYDYIDAEFTEGENAGKALSWVAKHNGRGYISYDFANHWQVFAEGIYTGERFIEGDNANLDPKLDSYVLTNIAINYSYQQWSASLRADNLLDEEYVSAGYYSAWGSGFYPGDGRNLRLTAGYRF
ncbi:TonB-dependent receptor family protein [Shewanella sp. OMA3-2]|uniref:TonB-dependent receptor family protein n=1 Tax=Shewanella sp. OMA3-2 TaxID=2908650 RepID=UPI001F4024D4|nr:TonB-dependent receptor [Shewanella sp. OMA3-2]UJF21624.1 TonB-dependent receptor [Shewanella sp. OMA3-2]